MTIDSLREVIAHAIMQEQHEGELRRWLSPRVPALNQHLLLPGSNALEGLMSFLIAYIEAVPTLLKLAAAGCAENDDDSGVSSLLAPLQDFFAGPDAYGGLSMRGLLEEAFVAMRLVEEINDHHLCCSQQALLPLELTEANVIVHHVIGDQRAVRLETRINTTLGWHLLTTQAARPDIPATGPSLDREPTVLPLVRAANQVRLRIAV